MLLPGGGGFIFYIMQSTRDFCEYSSDKIDNVAQVWGTLNFKGYQNLIIGSKVTVILRHGWILPFSGVAFDGSLINGATLKNFRIHQHTLHTLAYFKIPETSISQCYNQDNHVSPS